MKKKSKIAFGRLDLLRNDTLNNKNKIRIGFIGGGPNSFIGYTHRLSARFDNKFEFVAGIFSKDKKKSKSFGSSLGLADDRCYSDYKSMASAESKRNDGIQALGIMTPSGDHYKIAKAFIEKGIHIICDKPLTATVEDAVKLKGFNQPVVPYQYLDLKDTTSPEILKGDVVDIILKQPKDIESILHELKSLQKDYEEKLIQTMSNKKK